MQEFDATCRSALFCCQTQFLGKIPGEWLTILDLELINIVVYYILRGKAISLKCILDYIIEMLMGTVHGTDFHAPNHRSHVQ